MPRPSRFARTGNSHDVVTAPKRQLPARMDGERLIPFQKRGARALSRPLKMLLALPHENVPMPPRNPDIADRAPSDLALTPYDKEHAVIYMRMLNADAEGADWRKVARIVLRIDPEPCLSDS